jgi:56kDa selenium binding protein (SBP56)
MLQLSLDGRRLYVTNSLYSTWDNQFYPGLRSWLLRVNCDPNGGLEIDHDFFVDFHDRSDGPARTHEGPPPERRLHDGDLPVIAHIAGLPVEETIPQLAPIAAGAAFAVGLLIERARSRLRSLDPRSSR